MRRNGVRVRVVKPSCRGTVAGQGWSASMCMAESKRETLAVWAPAQTLSSLNLKFHLLEVDCLSRRVAISCIVSSHIQRDGNAQLTLGA